MTMLDSDRTASLREERQQLVDQLEAVDRALAALAATVRPSAGPGVSTAAADTAAPVVATRVKSARVLSDDHRRAVVEGARKARHSREAAAGRARESLDPSPGLAPASSASGPRLVKQSTGRTRVGD